ncbi:MAG TPA: M48 family metallopeptidase [Alphaproteobacteria bacterium]|nr:M48 family metallopeptidase [Alphaproteobacteria bacterium]HRK97912.1 M48 family metallopeptidase [Alphaproteobacteria bacterium]
MSMEKKISIIPYQHERKLFIIAFVISVIAWGSVLILTKGMILAIIPFVFLGYLIAQSGFVSYLKGSGALVSTKQFPDIQESVESCAACIGLKTVPNVYVLHMDGMFNAFALRFLHKQYVVLLSDIVDAMDKKPDALRFYIGHEMAHLYRKHTLWETFLTPALVLPLLGAAYSRSREYTCDAYGAACCELPESSRLGLAALAVGGTKYTFLNGEAYMDQLKDTKGFWMSFHELIGNYPWLIKRFARVGNKTETKIPNRNPAAYLLAVFVPRLSIMSAVVIYLVFIGITAMGAMKEFGHQGKSDTEYSSGYDDQENQAEEEYIAGEIYEGDLGKFYQFLGGDPYAESSWKEVPPPEAK